MPTYRDFFAEIKKRIHEATPEQVQDLIRSGDVQLGDVREKDEWNAGHIPGAVHVPKSYLEQWAEDRLPEKDKTTVLYCAGGVRSAMAADILQKLGYRNVISMAGGFNRWKDSGKPWTTPASFTPLQAQRYSRHLLIPEVGEAGQQKLLDSKVLLIGAGGLGSPAAYYLASAGGGTLRLVDSHVVGPPHPPPPELAPSCAEAGVLGVLPGVIGTIQATEAIKLLLGIGEPLVGRYLLYDALEGSFREVRLRRDPECPMCGERPTITDYIDYEGLCASPSEWREQHMPAKVSTPAE